jgi:rare lipoprotein A
MAVVVLALGLCACAPVHRASPATAATSTFPPPPTAPKQLPLAEVPIFTQTGPASWYRPKLQRRTASGEAFDAKALTAAHRSLPFGTVLRVTCLKTGRMVVVRVNDRGPFSHGRVLDLSAVAAEELGMKQDGEAVVLIEEFASDQT